MATIYTKPSSPFWQITWQENGKQHRQSSKVRHGGLKTVPQSVKRIASGIEERVALEQFGVEVGWKSISVEDAMKEEFKHLNLQAKLGKISEDRAMALQGELDRLRPWLAQAGITVLKDLTEDTAEAFLEIGIEQWASGTLKTRVGILAKFWQRHIDNGAPIRNHWKGQGIEANYTKKRSLTEEELTILLADLPKMPRELQFLTMMGMFTGARIMMCRRLTEEMVNFDKMVINFPKVKKKEHTSHIHHQLYQFLMDFPVREDGHYIDPDRNWSARFGYWVETQLRQGELFKDFTHHCLRVTFNTFMLESGLPEQVTMEIIGHSSPEAHKRYKDIKAQKYSGQIESALSGLKVG